MTTHSDCGNREVMALHLPSRSHVPAKHAIKFSVVIPVYNGLSYLPDCLRALMVAAERFPRIEVIVVDNGSTDGTYEWLLSNWTDRVRIFQLPKATIAAVRNYGARLAKGEYLCFIDSDCMVSADYFLQATDILSQPGISVTGCRYMLPENACWIERVWHGLHASTSDGIVTYLPSGNLIVRREAFFQVGGFEESLITGEDADLCRRLANKGFPVYQAQAVAAVHLGEPKTLWEFFRREVWHGIGMFQEAKSGRASKMLLLTLTHLGLTLTALQLALFGSGPLAPRLAVSFTYLCCAPALAVGYRWFKQRAFWYPLRGFALYAVYLAARNVSLFKLLFAVLRDLHAPQQLWRRA